MGFIFGTPSSVMRYLLFIFGAGLIFLVFAYMFGFGDAYLADSLRDKFWLVIILVIGLIIGFIIKKLTGRDV